MREEPALPELTDGTVMIRAPRPADTTALVAGRDKEFRRGLGEGSESPQPLACIVVAGGIVGWVDYDTDRDWLGPAQVNVGYNVFPDHRGHGYATRALTLLLAHLAERTPHTEATFLIDRANEASLGVAARLGAKPRDVTGIPPGQRFFVVGVG